MNKLSLYRLNSGFSASESAKLGSTGQGRVSGVRTPKVLRGIDPESPTIELGEKARVRGEAQTIPESGFYSPETGQGAGPGLVSYENLDIDTEIPGRLEIPKLGINVPIIWTKDPKNFSGDLKKGVVHYPGTALPGQIGTTYVSGHSSNYAWAKGDYNRVFSGIDRLQGGYSFKVTVVQKNGKDAVLHYVVSSKKEFKPDDPEQIKNTGESLVALSTCWPLNTTERRLVVFGELTQIVKK